MNPIDVVFFQAELAPDKLALVAHGSVIPYQRFMAGILSAQQRLSAIGITAGQTVAISVTHPIDHMVFACALYRMKVASASIDAAVDTYLERVRFDVVLSDKILPAVSAKQPAAKFIIVDPSWFQDKVALTLQQRTSASRDGSPDWVARITCSPADAHSPALVETSARTLEEALMAYCISAPPDWTRMISIAGLHSDSGFVQALSGLWLGRSVCFADVQSARSLSLLYRHDYLVGAAEQLEQLLRLQDTDFAPMHALRAAAFDGRLFSAASLRNALATICPNLLIRYVHPQIGIVAYGEASRMRGMDGAAGFVSPWIEAEALDGEGLPLPTGREGALRVRRRDRLVPLGRQPGEDDEADQSHPGWVHLRQRGKIANNVLTITGAHPN